ncbi:histidine phosphatase family protein [Microbacterium sp. KR10-403]|uniref:histidine phosphatase family protein n=1 Tax=Microbacterium sp. KR10-403 TaxID=3158581 RepID=UPI0032E3E216
MTATVYLVRHGRTTLNAQDRLRGLSDPPLDDVGVAQAEAVAAVLAGNDIAAVYSSPLQRAVWTAEAIAAQFGLSARPDARFNDRDYGPWTGHERRAVIEEFGSVDAAPGVEATADVLARVRPALDAVLQEDRAVVIVSHDAVIKPLIAGFAEGEEPVIPTGSWSELQWDNSGWRVIVAGRIPDLTAG